jgi:hypothetical protein
MNSDFGRFDSAIRDLGFRYTLGVELREVAAYFRQLSRYPIEMVFAAIERAPETYPICFPTAGQLVEICDDIAAKENFASDAVTIMRGAGECEHEDRFEPEPEGSLYAGFDVCARCGRAKPKERA